MTSQDSRVLVWRLHTVMSERDIRTSTELHRRLEPYGLDITSHQISRIVSKLPARLNTEVLAALMKELECEASDLLQLTEPRPARAAPQRGPAVERTSTSATSGRPAGTTSEASGVPDSVLGPKVTRLRREATE